MGSHTFHETSHVRDKETITKAPENRKKNFYQQMNTPNRIEAPVRKPKQRCGQTEPTRKNMRQTLDPATGLGLEAQRDYENGEPDIHCCNRIDFIFGD
jgi:hypothetical protein